MARNKGGLSIMVDFDEVAEFIGHGKAWETLSKDTKYIDMIINNALQETNEHFNTFAAANGPNIKHMFEWGTLGVNRARTNRRPRPDSEAARLWITRFRGSGRQRTIDFDYKLSTAKVPWPTKTKTGIETKFLRLKRKHTFRHKAFVMESGVSVTIAPKKAKALFVPNPAAPRRFSLLKQSVETTPGRESAGSFTGFFTTYWNGPGHDRIQEVFGRNFEDDVVDDIYKTSKGTLKPAGTPLKGSISRAEKATVRSAKGKAASRQV